MDILTFIAKLVEFTAWPIATVVLVAMLHGEIKRLLPHIKKLKAGLVEAEFEREVKELQTTVEAQPQLLPPPERGAPEWQMLMQLVQINPRSAILEAWRGVEDAAIRVIQKQGLYVSERDSQSPLAIIRTLNKEKVFSSEEVSLYHELRSLRNQATHAQDFSPTTEAALSYIGLAERLRKALEVTLN
jgi:hypothetical protein